MHLVAAAIRWTLFLKRASTLTLFCTDGYAKAVDVYNCWITVPFNPAVGSRFVKYWNGTLQFQGTLEYLRQPPAGYQQPPVDLIAGVNDVQHTIDSNGFANEYQVEAALQSLLFSAHDSHVSLDAGLLSSFYFGSVNGLTAVSLDGVQLPKVYLTDDLIANQSKTDEYVYPDRAAQREVDVVPGPSSHLLSH